MRLNENFNIDLIKHLNLKNKELAFDVGAYIGDSIPGIRSMGYKHIICFEPDHRNFGVLQSAYGADKNITLIKKAVSDISGKTVRMYSTRNLPFLNSLSKEWITDTRHKQFYRPNQFEEFDVETITLDEFIKSIGKSPSYIKIDVEGHESKVLDGLNYKSEFLSFEWISEKTSVNIMCINRLTQLGYTEFTICFNEALPKENCVWLSDFKLIDSFKELNKNDTANSLSGNIFCK